MRTKEEIFKELQMYKLTDRGMQHVTITCAERLVSEVFDGLEEEKNEINKKYIDLVESYVVESFKLFIELRDQQPRIISHGGDILCHYCNAKVYQDHDKDCTYSKIQEFIKDHQEGDWSHGSK